MEFADFTRAQIEELNLSPGRPLIISDADEVIVHFARPLQDFLAKQDLVFEIRDYRLFGNVRRRADNQVIEHDHLMELIDHFFEAEVENLPPVEGSVQALTSLAERAQVVVLTNLPVLYRDRRIKAFLGHGLNAPVLANTGLKGAPVKALAARVQAPVVFIDDIPQHIRSVAEAVPDSFRVHFIADERLAKVQARAEDCHHRCDRWPTTREAVERFLDSAGH